MSCNLSTCTSSLGNSFSDCFSDPPILPFLGSSHIFIETNFCIISTLLTGAVFSEWILFWSSSSKTGQHSLPLRPCLIIILNSHSWPSPSIALIKVTISFSFTKSVGSVLLLTCIFAVSDPNVLSLLEIRLFWPPWIHSVIASFLPLRVLLLHLFYRFFYLYQTLKYW